MRWIRRCLLNDIMCSRGGALLSVTGTLLLPPYNAPMYEQGVPQRQPAHRHALHRQHDAWYQRVVPCEVLMRSQERMHRVWTRSPVVAQSSAHVISGSGPRHATAMMKNDL